MTPGASERPENHSIERLLDLIETGQHHEAEDSARSLLAELANPRARAEVLFDVVMAMLARGHRSGLIAEAVASQLSLADRHLAADRRPAAAHAFGRAIRVAFHRALHLHSASSPLAEDPEAFTAALRASATAAALRASRGRRTEPEPRKPTGGGVTRIAVLTRENDNFLHEIRELVGTSERFELRFIDLADDHEDLLQGVAAPAAMAKEILTGAQGAASRAEERLRPLFNWADVVFVEWCIAHAALVNLVDPRDTRVIIRLHSYEAFTAWPQLIDWRRVDDVLFVSDHLRDLARAAIPGLDEPGAPPSRVLPLSLRLQPFVRPKPDTARFNLGLVGWSAAAKDPLWAIEVVRQLRLHDPAYRLLLVGEEFDASRSATTAAYGERLDAELAALEAVGAITRIGRTEDVPAALTEIGVILSTSVRESFHAGLVEGAASGAVPVVRDWPFFAGKAHGARTLFPGDWVVATSGDAVERILATTGSEEVWRETGSAASAHVMKTWDWSVTKADYEHFLRGDDGNR